MKKFLLWPVAMLSLCISLLMPGAPAFAQSVDASSPDGLIKTITSEVINTVKNDKSIQQGDLTRITELVNEKILPYTDFETTTRLAMGRNWNVATPDQRAKIVEQFKLLLIRTYSGAIAQIRDQQVQYLPFRSSPGDTQVVVRTQVVNQASPIELDYRLRKVGQDWKVFDINVLGAWLIQAYKQQFDEQIQQHGIDGLIQFLTQRNQQLAAGKQ